MGLSTEEGRLRVRSRSLRWSGVRPRGQGTAALGRARAPGPRRECRLAPDGLTQRCGICVLAGARLPARSAASAAGPSAGGLGVAEGGACQPAEGEAEADGCQTFLARAQQSAACLLQFAAIFPEDGAPGNGAATGGPGGSPRTSTVLDSFGCSHSIGLSIIHLPVICQLSVCLSIYPSIHPLSELPE